MRAGGAQYSVPSSWADLDATAYVGVETIRVVCGGEQVEFPRERRGRRTVRYRHYLTELAKKPQAIGFAALDSKAAIPLLKKAQAEKIPVIAFDSGVDSDIPVTTCRTDSVAAAATAADKMATAIGDAGGRVLPLQVARDGFRFSS